MTIIMNPDGTEYDNSLPFEMVNANGVNLTSSQISAWEAQQAAYAAQSAISTTQNGAMQALTEADRTLDRITEAVSLGLTTWTTADVVTWMNYRRSLRTLVTSQTAQSLPSKPNYPQGT